MGYRKSIKDWCEQQTRCAVCWCELAHCWPPASVHHLVHRSKRRCDDIWNLLPLCGGCHEAHHGQTQPGHPSLTFGHLLAAKLESDPQNWQPEKLEEAYGKRLPFLMPIPKEYLHERGYIGAIR